MDTIGRIKKHPIGNRKLKTVTYEHLQAYMDFLSFGGQRPDGTTAKPLAVNSIRAYSAVLKAAFRFAVLPKRLISFNPMEYVIQRHKDDDYELFPAEAAEELDEPVITYEQFVVMSDLLTSMENPALLPIQISYYTGLRIGEACGLTWQDIDLKSQCLTVRRSMSYSPVRKQQVIGPTKRRKIRTVDFCDTLAEILKKAKREQMLESLQCGELYRQNYYKTVKVKNRTYYEVYTLQRGSDVPEDYTGISFVCLRHDGSYERSSTVSSMCRSVKKKVEGMGGFHFHALRHTFATNMLVSCGAGIKDVQEMLGHSKADTTLNIYAHATKETKRSSARLLDKAVSGE